MRRRQFIGLVGVVAAWPLLARAQQAEKVIGFLSSRSAADSKAVLAAFVKGVGETGLVESRDFKIEYRWANGNFDTIPNLVKELVAKRVSLIAAVGGPYVTRAASDATKTIPIVFVSGTDPVKSGLVNSLNRPSGKITGVTLYSTELEQKKLELLREIMPGAASVGALLYPFRPDVADIKADIEAAAGSLHVSVQILFAGSLSDIDAAFGMISANKLQGLVVGTDAFFSTHRARIIKLAADYSVPAIYDSAIQVAEGGLMSYGASYADAYKQVGIYAGRILKGVPVADLPVQLPTKFELVINIKTAKALGLNVPQQLQQLADDIIE
jgi:putative ABC transport system substrate-binding protein